MKRLGVLVLLLVLVPGCAIGRIRHSDVCGSEISCLSVGHSACELRADGSAKIHGGALSNNLSEAIGSFLTAAGAAFSIYLGGGM